MDKQDVLSRFIPNSLAAVEVLNLALRLRDTWEDAPSVKLLINDVLVIEGNSNAFTNPAIEAGVIHCRSLLEFLGLSMAKGSVLSSPTRPRRPDDIGIEHFANEKGPLALVSPAQAISHYPGPAVEAEQALLSVFRIANKGLAHLTSAFLPAHEDARLLEIASRGVPALVVSYLYTPLGLHPPAPQVRCHAREAG